jgi:hypothetical protein
MPPSCKYANLGGREVRCEEVQWVVAYICDKCEGEGTADLCRYHYNIIYNAHDHPRLGCDRCQGTISWVSENLDHDTTAEAINEN